jgi:hypothetical protein
LAQIWPPILSAEVSGTDIFAVRRPAWPHFAFNFSNKRKVVGVEDDYSFSEIATLAFAATIVGGGVVTAIFEPSGEYSGLLNH